MPAPQGRAGHRQARAARPEGRPPAARRTRDAGPDQRRRADRGRRSRWPPAGRPASRPPCSRRRWSRPPRPGTGSGRLEDPAQRTQQRLHFFKNVSMLGGLIIAAGDTEGKPGVAWRDPPRRQGRPPRGQAPRPRRPPRGEARPGPDQLTPIGFAGDEPLDRGRPLARAPGDRPRRRRRLAARQQVADQPRAGPGRDRRRPVRRTPRAPLARHPR